MPHSPMLGCLGASSIFMVGRLYVKVVEGDLFEVACVDHSVPTPAWNASAISDISDNRLSIHMILDIHCHQSVIVRSAHKN